MSGGSLAALLLFLRITLSKDKDSADKDKDEKDSDTAGNNGVRSVWCHNTIFSRDRFANVVLCFCWRGMVVAAVVLVGVLLWVVKKG
jgi:hypothetical protein